jgi:hypothetical protein
VRTTSTWSSAYRIEPVETRWGRGLLAIVDSGGQRRNVAPMLQGQAQGATVPPHVKGQKFFLKFGRGVRGATRGRWGTT